MAATDVTILGKQITIRSDGEDDYIREVAKYVNERMEEVQRASQSTATLNVAILAAMNIADDFFRSEGRNRAITGDLSKRIDEIVSFIDEKLAAD